MTDENWSDVQREPLLACVGLDRHLVARCASPGCARAAPCDPSHWVAQGLGGLPLRAFTDRMRCVCGGRRFGWFIRWPGWLVGRRAGRWYCPDA